MWFFVCRLYMCYRCCVCKCAFNIRCWCFVVERSLVVRVCGGCRFDVIFGWFFDNVEAVKQRDVFQKSNLIATPNATIQLWMVLQKCLFAFCGLQVREVVWLVLLISKRQ